MLPKRDDSEDGQVGFGKWRRNEANVSREILLLSKWLE